MVRGPDGWLEDPPKPRIPPPALRVAVKKDEEARKIYADSFLRFVHPSFNGVLRPQAWNEGISVCTGRNERSTP